MSTRRLRCASLDAWECIGLISTFTIGGRPEPNVRQLLHCRESSYYGRFRSMISRLSQCSDGLALPKSSQVNARFCRLDPRNPSHMLEHSGQLEDRCGMDLCE